MRDYSKKIILTVILTTCVSLACPLTSAAKKSKISANTANRTIQREWGFGLNLGDPTGVSAKYWLNPVQAFDFSVGSQLAAPGVSLHADYLHHLRVFPETPEVPLYFGGGVFIGGNNSTFTGGARGVIGLTYLFEQPFDVYMQLTPKLFLAPSASFQFGFSIGARIYLQ